MAEDAPKKLKIYNYQKPMKLLSDLYFTKHGADIMIKLTGSETHNPFKVHKYIVATGSEYFKKELKKERPEPDVLSLDSVGIRLHRMLMSYLYSGKITLKRRDIIQDLNILGLVDMYQAKELDGLIAKRIEDLLDMENVFKILSTIDKYDCPQLKETCLHFLDGRAEKVIASVGFYQLDKKIAFAMLSRSSFVLPELDIYKLVLAWRMNNVNQDIENSLMSCVRFGWMSTHELLTEVSKDKTINSEAFILYLHESFGIIEKSEPGRTTKDVNVNVAVLRPCKVTFEDVTEKFNLQKSYPCNIFESQRVKFQLDHAFVINHIKFTLVLGCSRYCNYDVNVSGDGDNFTNLFGYKIYNCTGEQNLYFTPMKVQHIYITISFCEYDTEPLAIDSFGCYYTENTPVVYDSVIAPQYNVALLKHGARVVKGHNPECILNGNFHNYNFEAGYTYHTINSEDDCILIQLAQPFMISEIKMLLWDKEPRAFRYRIKSSVNGKEWESVADCTKTDFKSWQTLTFFPRTVIYIQIQGTFSTKEDMLAIVHFECYAGPDCFDLS